MFSSPCNPSGSVYTEEELRDQSLPEINDPTGPACERQKLWCARCGYQCRITPFACGRCAPYSCFKSFIADYVSRRQGIKSEYE